MGVTPDELRARRAALGMTQEQLAAALGVDRVSVARWEADPTTANSRQAPAILEPALRSIESERLR